MRHALREARRCGHRSILLVGDASYYGRFAFTAEKTGALWLPGPYEQHRLLACELLPGALAGARGLVSGRGRPQPTADLNGLVAALAGNQSALSTRAA
jgi:predicted N-acetyltransferase YhbS